MDSEDQVDNQPLSPEDMDPNQPVSPGSDAMDINTDSEVEKYEAPEEDLPAGGAEDAKEIFSDGPDSPLPEAGEAAAEGAEDGPDSPLPEAGDAATEGAEGASDADGPDSPLPEAGEAAAEGAEGASDADVDPNQPVSPGSDAMDINTDSEVERDEVPKEDLPAGGAEDAEETFGDGPDSPLPEAGEAAAEGAEGASAAGAAQAANADLMDPEEQNNLIANIFGDSDDEEGDFLGFDVDTVTATKRQHTAGDDSDSDPGVIDPHPRGGHSTAGRASDDDDDDVIDDGRAQPNAEGLSDFDLMMQRKRAGRKKRKKQGDAVTGMDDYVRSFIREMRAAYEEDRVLNERSQAATKKLKMLPTVLRCLNQADLMHISVDLGVLPVVAQWLTPLPDGSLPHITIRDGLIAWLTALPELSQDQLKSSQVGKSIMFLYRHPKETRENRKRTGKLIGNWSRMIFGLQSNYKLMSRDEREERDYLHMQRQQQQSSDAPDDSQKEGGLLGEGGQALKPGDRGFVGRARVPTPSNKDYIVRPKWNVNQEAGHNKGKKEPNRFEKQQLKQKQQKQLGKTRRAAAISLVGTKMSL